MNLAQQLGEQALRIDTLEEMVRAGGGDPDAGARLDTQLQKERAAHARELASVADRLAALQDQHRDTREALRVTRLREVEQKRQLEVKTQALLDADRVNAKLQAQLSEQEQTIDRLTAAGDAVAALAVAVKPTRMRRSLGLNGSTPGSCAHEILKLLPAPPDSFHYASIRSRLLQFKASNISVTLHYLAKTGQVIRQGSKHHYTYSKKVSS